MVGQGQINKRKVGREFIYIWTIELSTTSKWEFHMKCRLFLLCDCVHSSVRNIGVDLCYDCAERVWEVGIRLYVCYRSWKNCQLLSRRFEKQENIFSNIISPEISESWKCVKKDNIKLHIQNSVEYVYTYLYKFIHIYIYIYIYKYICIYI